MPHCLTLLNDDPSSDFLINNEQTCLLDQEAFGSCWDYLPWSCICGEASECHLASAQKFNKSSTTTIGSKSAPAAGYNNFTFSQYNGKDFLHRNINQSQFTYQFQHYGKLERYMEQYRQQHTLVARLFNTVSSAGSVPINGGSSTNLINRTFAMTQQQQQQQPPPPPPPPQAQQQITSTYAAVPQNPDPWIKPRIPPLTHSTSVEAFVTDPSSIRVDSIGCYPLTTYNCDNDTAFITVSGFGPRPEAVVSGTTNDAKNVPRRISDGTVLTPTGRAIWQLRRESSGIEVKDIVNDRSIKNSLVRDGSSIEFASILQEKLKDLQRQQQQQEEQSRHVALDSTRLNPTEDINPINRQVNVYPLKGLTANNRVASMKRIVPNRRGNGRSGSLATTGSSNSVLNPNKPRVREMRLWCPPSLDPNEKDNNGGDNIVAGFVTVTSCFIRNDSHRAARLDSDE